MKLDLKEWIAKETKAKVYVGSETNLGTVTLGSGGYASFTRPTLPSGATLIGYQVAFGSCTGAWHVPAYYGTNAYVIGTPNAKITNLRVYPIYVIGGGG